MASDPSTTTEQSLVLFVYGSLLRGQSNHFWMRAARYLGEASTEPRFELLDLGPFPALVAGGSTAVHGELYEVDAVLLARLDVFEDVPEMYRRDVVQLQGQASAQAYLLQPSHAQGRPRVPSGDWRKR
jgi:gamma-glutamylaminecyclotransferase